MKTGRRVSLNIADDNRTVAVSRDVLYEHLDDEVVLLDMRAGTYFGLSPVASQLWRAFADGKSIRQARNLLLDIFDVQPDTLDADLDLVINSLFEKQLISFQPTSSNRV